MPVIAKRYKIKFDETKLNFSENYPQALQGALSLAEFDSVIRKINEDMTMEIKDRNKKVKKWSLITLAACVVIAGIALTPVLFVQTRRQKKELKQFWERLRNYLGEINRKTYLRRNLEWKLVEDRRKLKLRDVVNPLLAYRMEIIHRTAGPKKRLGRRSDEEEGAGVVLEPSSTAYTQSGMEPQSSFSTEAAQRRSIGSFSMLSYNTEPSGTLGASGSTPSSSPLSDEEEEEEEEEIEDDDDDDVQVIVESPADADGFRRSSLLDDDIVIEAEEDDDYGEDFVGDSGNLASISSQGAGSYSRGSIIITPMQAALGAPQIIPEKARGVDSAAKEDEKKKEDKKEEGRGEMTGEEDKEGREKEKEMEEEEENISEESPKSVIEAQVAAEEEGPAADVEVKDFAEQEESAAKEEKIPLEGEAVSSDDKDQSAQSDSAQNRPRPSKVRLSSRFKSDEE